MGVVAPATWKTNVTDKAKGRCKKCDIPIQKGSYHVREAGCHDEMHCVPEPRGMDLTFLFIFPKNNFLK